MRKLDERDMEEFGRLESSEKTTAILGDRWWAQTAEEEGDRISKHFLCNIWQNSVFQFYVSPLPPRRFFLRCFLSTLSLPRFTASD